jgi:hypothetical protein
MKEDVSIIYADDNFEHVHNGVFTFGSDNVTLISGINTSYICDYTYYKSECV